MKEILDKMEIDFEFKAEEDEGCRKQIALMQTICYEIDLTDNMNVEENLLTMRNAGKKRMTKKLRRNEKL